MRTRIQGPPSFFSSFPPLSPIFSPPLSHCLFLPFPHCFSLFPSSPHPLSSPLPFSPLSHPLSPPLLPFLLFLSISLLIPKIRHQTYKQGRTRVAVREFKAPHILSSHFRSIIHDTISFGRKRISISRPTEIGPFVPASDNLFCCGDSSRFDICRPTYF